MSTEFLHVTGRPPQVAGRVPPAPPLRLDLGELTAAGSPPPGGRRPRRLLAGLAVCLAGAAAVAPGVLGPDDSPDRPPEVRVEEQQRPPSEFYRAAGQAIAERGVPAAELRWRSLDEATLVADGVAVTGFFARPKRDPDAGLFVESARLQPGPRLEGDLCSTVASAARNAGERPASSCTQSAAADGVLLRLDGAAYYYWAEGRVHVADRSDALSPDEELALLTDPRLRW